MVPKNPTEWIENLSLCLSAGAFPWQILTRKQTEKEVLGNAVRGFSFAM